MTTTVSVVITATYSISLKAHLARPLYLYKLNMCAF